MIEIKKESTGIVMSIGITAVQLIFYSNEIEHFRTKDLST
jgi:hypothetical protein